MGITDDITQMRREGKGDGEIYSALRSRGLPEQEVSNAMSQSDIKQAVTSRDLPDLPDHSQDNLFNPSGNLPEPTPPEQFSRERNFESPVSAPQYNSPKVPSDDEYIGSGGGEGEYSAGGNYEGMQPSMMSQQPAQEVQQQEYAPQGDYGNYDQGYSMYQPYQEAISSDIITEISEQIVDEKLSKLHGKVEKILDMKTTVESSLGNLDERMKRMEKIVDQMQISLLKKVGDYLTDVQDLKKELEETQKSFVAVHKKKKH